MIPYEFEGFVMILGPVGQSVLGGRAYEEY